MYSLSRKINSSKRIILSDYPVLVSSDNMLLTLQGREIFQFRTNIVGIKSKANFLFVESFSETDGLEKTEVIDLHSNELVVYPGLERIMLRNGFLGDYIIALYYDSEFNTRAGVLRFDKAGIAVFNQLNIDFEVVFFKLENEVVCIADKSTVYLFKPGEKNYYLSISLKSLPGWKDIYGADFSAELSCILGVYNGLLWLNLKQFHIIGVDIFTGQIKESIFLPEVFSFPENGPWQKRMSIGDLHLDKEKGVIMSLAHWRYWELDLNTCKGVVKRDFGHLDNESKQAWSIHKSWFYQGEQYLYFIGKRKQQDSDTFVGVFDTNTAEVIWHDEPFSPGSNSNFIPLLQRDDKYLAIQDNESNVWLYIRN